MNTVKVTTNNIPRDLIYSQELELYGFNLTEVKSDYDWLDSEEFECVEWFVYKSELYCLSDFMAIHNHFYNPNPPDWMLDWEGYYSFGFIGGLVIKYPRMDYNENEIDSEHIIVGWY